MLWIVRTVFSAPWGLSAYCVLMRKGSMAVCQSLQCSTSGAKSGSIGIASMTARWKKAYCSASASPPR